MVEFIDKPIQRKPAVHGGGTPAGNPAPGLKHTVNIAGYTIISKIGEGASSTVWKAKQESLKRVVAIKILKKSSAADKSDVESFIHEAKILAKLKNPHTIQIYDIGSTENTFYLVMEYLDCQSLKELLKAKGHLPQKEALNIAAAVANALDEAWNVGGIYHGDIKPDNIMLENDGSIKLSNLGLSRILVERNLAPDNKDAPYYISPEMAKGEGSLDFRSDMYSLGALLYHMLTGSPPFAGKSKGEILSAHNLEQIAYPCDLNPAISPGCAQIITRLMMVGPDYRFKEWSTVFSDLTKLAEGKIVVTKVNASAISTIAKPGTIKTPVTAARKPMVASKKPGANKKQLKELKNKYSKKKAAAWLTFPLEIAMIAWFGWLGYQLIWLPTHPAEPAEAVSRPVTPEQSVPAVNPEAAERRTPARTHVKPEPVESERPSRSEIEKPAVQPSPPQKDDTPVVEDSKPAAAPLPELKREIVKMLLKKQPDEALDLLKENYPDSSSDEIAELTKIILSCKLREKAVAAVFARSIGMKKSLFYKGRRRQISVTGVKGTTVSADVYSTTGSSTITRGAKFKISDLEPLEQSRWLGEPETPKIAVIKFMLHMEAGDYAAAKKAAAKCGPLADACSAEVDAKIKMLME